MPSWTRRLRRHLAVSIDVIEAAIGSGDDFMMVIEFDGQADVFR